MLVLLPPSEGKTQPSRGRPLDLSTLSAPELTEHRSQVLTALVDLCSGDPARAAEVLGLGPTQQDEVLRNRELPDVPTAPAGKVYTGVLYAALDAQTLTGPDKRRLNRWVRVQSALFGLVSPTDRIPAYRLSGDVRLPGIGSVAGHWRRPMTEVVPSLAGRGLVIDLRSGLYTGFWRGDRRTVTVRVLHETGGKRAVVSHFNKATKGRLVRALVRDGGTPTTGAELTEHLKALGWLAEYDGDRRIDVVVSEL